MRSPVSIKDIARMADVSHSTVSRALRDSPLVNPETRKIIHKLAKEHGYRASLVGRSLVNRCTRTIGCVVTSIADPFVGPVVGGIEECANQHGYSVFLANSNADPEREIQVVLSLHERRVDGVVVAASRVGALYIPQLAELGIPIVLINNQNSGEYACSVVIENVAEARKLVRHLIALGHRRIGYIGDRFGGHSDAERQAGYRSAIGEASISYDSALVVQGDSHPEGGRAAMEHLLALRNPPTAVFCYNDVTALGVYGALHARGIAIPGGMSVVGFDDLFFSQYLQPPLTTIRQPMHDMGRQAMGMLLDLMNDEARGRSVRLDGKLIVRGSTAAPQETP